MIDWLVGPFDRNRARVDESNAVYRALTSSGFRTGTMFDVGAHRGSSLQRFASDGWQVYAFEPDPLNRSFLMATSGQLANVEVDYRPVSSSDGLPVTFYRSPDSTGVSGLNPFLDSHEPIAQAKTVSLSSFICSRSVEHVDFLKIDVEGHDFEVLKGFPWHRLRPTAIVAEFEDAKTGNYTQAQDMCAYLHELGYSVLASEWHPIIRYGISHDYRGLWEVTDPSMINDVAWGNVIAVAPVLLQAVVLATEAETTKR